MKLPASINHFFLAVMLVFVFSGLSPRTARAVPLTQAAQEIAFESVLVDVWPEYDQPSVLIISTITLASTVSLPASLSMSIPAAAGKPYALAMKDVNGLYDLQYNISAAGDMIKVNFTTPVPEVRLEYYDPGLAKNGQRREFTFRWPADYAVNNLVVKVQQPMTASNITFLPDIGAGRVDSDGLTYFTQVVGKVAAGTTFDLDMAYDKPDDKLTNPQQFQPVQPAAPLESATPGRVTLLGFAFTPLQAMLLIAGVVFLLVGVVWYGLAAGGLPGLRRAFGASEPGGSERERKRHARSGSTGPLSAEGETGPAEPVFCHRCGKKSAGGDAFCRACGTRLRG